MVLACIAAAASTGATIASAQPPGAAAATGVGMGGDWEGEANGPDRWPLFLTLQLRDGASGRTGRLLMLGQTIELGSVGNASDAFTASIGDAPNTLRLEGRIESDRLVGRLTQGSTTLTFVLQRIPALAAPANRVEAWRQDLDALGQRLPLWDRSFSAEERARFDSALALLRQDLPRLNDQQIMARIAAAVALSHNAHTRLYLLRVRTAVRFLPVRLWWFRDQLRIAAADAAHASLLGCRVTAIDGHAVTKARAMVAPAFAGNRSWTDYMTSYSLASSDMLHGFGVSPSAEGVTYQLSDCAVRGPVRLEPLPLERLNRTVEAWWDLAPDRTQPGWRQVLQERRVRTPLFLQRTDRSYWHADIPDERIFYVQYNRAAEMDGEPLEAYAQRVARDLERSDATAFVLDLRYNTGGNTNLARDLMHSLQERTSGMRRFVITGRATFSAGIVHAAQWRNLPNVTFVGEPVGDDRDFWSEGGNVILPHSGLAAHFGNGFHSLSPAPCPQGLHCVDESVRELTPDIAISPSWSDYATGRDAEMVAIIRAMHAERPSSSRRSGSRAAGEGAENRGRSRGRPPAVSPARD